MGKNVKIGKNQNYKILQFFVQLIDFQKILQFFREIDMFEVKYQYYINSQQLFAIPINFEANFSPLIDSSIFGILSLG